MLKQSTQPDPQQPKSVVEAQKKMEDFFFSSAVKMKALHNERQSYLHKEKKHKPSHKQQLPNHIEEAIKEKRKNKDDFSTLATKDHLYMLGRKETNYDYEGNYKVYKSGLRISRSDEETEIVVVEILNKKKQRKQVIYRNKIHEHSLQTATPCITLTRYCEKTKINAFYRIHPKSYWKTDINNLISYLREYSFTLKSNKGNHAACFNQIITFYYWLFTCSIEGLKQYHEKKQHHGDIKVENMLATTTGKIIFIDDLDISLRKKRIHNTIATMSPDNPIDFLNKYNQNPTPKNRSFTKPDIYSLGAELLMFLTLILVPTQFQLIDKFNKQLSSAFKKAIIKNKSITKTYSDPLILKIILNHNIQLRTFIYSYTSQIISTIPELQQLLLCCYYMLDPNPETRHIPSLSEEITIKSRQKYDSITGNNQAVASASSVCV